MQLCSDGHEEVAFAGAWESDCPACAYVREVREEMQEQIDELKQELGSDEQN